jgi:DNA-directed RNA polymerase specialized sigma24 family protein
MVITLSLEGLSQEEIAVRMGIAVATVKWLKAEGIKKLRTMLDGAVLALVLAGLC